jgi:hypothetical protein
MLGWNLVLSNFLAIPLMGLTGIFLEGDLSEDYSGVFGFIALSYFLMPYQAYVALKGLVETEEGYWFRTLKTGHINDYFLDMKLRGLIEWLNKRRKGRGSNLLDRKLFPLKIPVNRLLFSSSFFFVIWPVLEFVSGVSTGCSFVYYSSYLLRGVVNG